MGERPYRSPPTIWFDTSQPTIFGMYDVLILCPGGGWATDTTGNHRTVTDRAHWLRTSTRGRRQILRIIDRRTGHEVHA